MSMNINGVSNNYAGNYTNAEQVSSETNTVAGARNVVSGSSDKTLSEAVVYEKNSETNEKATYSVNKMSKEDRAALVEQLKADQAARESSLTSLVSKMLSQQTNTYGKANNIWSFLASGEYTVDAATKAQAQKDISEDGYYGVKQTSQRLFDFASALAGDDVEQMKKMQAAIEKGYKQAEKVWGGKLPGISQDTMSATNKLFEDYYASKDNAEQ